MLLSTILGGSLERCNSREDEFPDFCNIGDVFQRRSIASFGMRIRGLHQEELVRREEAGRSMADMAICGVCRALTPSVLS
jgi:hypothetical protein